MLEGWVRLHRLHWDGTHSGGKPYEEGKNMGGDGRGQNKGGGGGGLHLGIGGFDR